MYKVFHKNRTEEGTLVLHGQGLAIETDTGIFLVTPEVSEKLRNTGGDIWIEHAGPNHSVLIQMGGEI